jgi:hypothetical protein
MERSWVVKLRTAVLRVLMALGAIVGTVGVVMLWNGGEKAEASHGHYFNLRT